VTPAQVADGTEHELGDLRDGDWQVDHVAPGQVSLSRNGSAAGQPVGVSKTIRLAGGRLDPELIVELELHHRGDVPVQTRLGLELSLHLLGGGGNPSAWYDVAGSRTGHDSAGQAPGIEVIGYGNDWVGVAVEGRPEPTADAWWSPIETISNSEAGFERVYQGSLLLVSWPLTLVPGETRRFSFTQRVAVARDKGEPELAGR
jgi:4-alpha-glucanotransferase